MKSFLRRNDRKNSIINEIMNQKVELNKELSTLIQNSFDVNIYRDKVNELRRRYKNFI